MLRILCALTLVFGSFATVHCAGIRDDDRQPTVPFHASSAVNVERKSLVAEYYDQIPAHLLPSHLHLVSLLNANAAFSRSSSNETPRRETEASSTTTSRSEVMTPFMLRQEAILHSSVGDLENQLADVNYAAPTQRFYPAAEFQADINAPPYFLNQIASNPLPFQNANPAPSLVACPSCSSQISSISNSSTTTNVDLTGQQINRTTTDLTRATPIATGIATIITDLATAFAAAITSLVSSGTFTTAVNAVLDGIILYVLTPLCTASVATQRIVVLVAGLLLGLLLLKVKKCEGYGKCTKCKKAKKCCPDDECGSSEYSYGYRSMASSSDAYRQSLIVQLIASYRWNDDDDDDPIERQEEISGR